MSHYEEQREAQRQAEQDEEMYRLRSMSIADYEHYIDGARQNVELSKDEREEILGLLVEQNQLLGLYEEDSLIDHENDTNDLYNYMEPEFLDFLEVLKMGAAKHGNANWIQINGKKSSHKDMHDSMFHHLSLSYANRRLDGESGLDHLLHLASRALMLYTRLKRGMTHPED